MEVQGKRLDNKRAVKLNYLRKSYNLSTAKKELDLMAENMNSIGEIVCLSRSQRLNYFLITSIIACFTLNHIGQVESLSRHLLYHLVFFAVSIMLR